MRVLTFHKNCVQLAATRRPEIDQNGTLKRSSPKPISKRYTSFKGKIIGHGDRAPDLKR